ncbi:DUF998 domain-containing protein [Bacteroidota bacterium]
MRRYLILAFIFDILFFIAVVLIHFINSDLEILSTPLSYYLDARYGYILKTGLIFFGLAEILMSVIFYIKKQDTLKICAILLFIAGISVIITSFSPVNYRGIEINLLHLVHVYAATAQLLFLPVVAFLYSKSDPNKNIRLVSKIIGVITYSLFIFILIILNFEESKIFGYYGLLQKIDIFLMIFWIGLILKRIMKFNQ